MHTLSGCIPALLMQLSELAVKLVSVLGTWGNTAGQSFLNVAQEPLTEEAIMLLVNLKYNLLASLDNKLISIFFFGHFFSKKINPEVLIKV